MAVTLPGPDDIAPVGVARDPGVRSSPDDFGAQIGRAQQMAGEAIQNIGEIGMRLAQQRQDAEDKIFFSTVESQNALRINKQMLEAEAAAPAGGEGFTAGVQQSLTEGGEALLEQMIQERGFRPSKRAVDLARARLEEQKAGALIKAQTYEHNARIKWLGDQFIEQGNQFAQEAYSSGDPVDALAKLYEGGQVYEGVIPEAELIEATKKAELAIVQSAIQGLTEAGRVDEAEALTERFFGARPATRPVGDTPVDQLVNQIIQVESGGNANAKNPNSSAAGLGQFIDSTWLAMVRQHRPDVAQGKPAQQVIALKSDPALSREMTAAYAQENANYLTDQALPVTAGNLYLAHFLGPGGAVRVLKADPGAPIADVVGQEVVNANPFLKGKSASEVAAWADQKMQQAPRSSRAAILPNAEAASQNYAQIDRVRSQQATQAKAEYDAHKGSLELGIETGDVAAPETILNDEILSDAHKADLLKALRTRQGDEMATREALAAFRAGNLAVDPYSSDGKKVVDNLFKAISEAVPPEQLQAQTEEIVRQTGTVPQQVVNRIRQGLTSADANEVMAAALSAQRIRAVNAAAFERRDGGREADDAAIAYSHLTGAVGLSPEEAARRIMDARDPEKVKARAALMESKPVKDFIKDTATEGAVRDIFDPGVFGFDPQLGETPAQSAAMVGEYRLILEESMFDANGDEDLAKTMAAERFKRRYGTSELTLSGPGIVSRLPPETAYPAVNGTHDYIRNQVFEAMSAEGIQSEEYFLQAYDQTDKDFRAGRPPRYQVWYRDGESLEMFHLPFYAVPGAEAAEAPMPENRRRRERNLQMESERQATIDSGGRGPNPLNEMQRAADEFRQQMGGQ